MVRFIDSDLNRGNCTISFKCVVKRISRFFVAASICLSASACGLVEKRQRYSCPEVFILNDAQKLTRFQPGLGRDNSDIRFVAKISDFRGECDYNQDQGEWTVGVDLFVQISLDRGPANRSGDISFEYFVLLPDFEGKPGGKRIFAIDGVFREDSKRQIYQDNVQLLVPLKTPSEGAGTEIVLGFQLTRDELKFNRAR